MHNWGVDVYLNMRYSRTWQRSANNYLQRCTVVWSLCQRLVKDSSADRTSLSGLSPVHVTHWPNLRTRPGPSSRYRKFRPRSLYCLSLPGTQTKEKLSLLQKRLQKKSQLNSLTFYTVLEISCNLALLFSPVEWCCIFGFYCKSWKSWATLLRQTAAMEVNKISYVSSTESSANKRTLKTSITNISLEKQCPTSLTQSQISLWAVLIIFYFGLKIVCGNKK